MNDKIIEQLLNYDYTEIEKIPGQISSINDNTKAILEQLQKQNESTEEFQTFMMTEEPTLVEEPTGDETEEVPIEEAVTEEIVVEDSTEVTEELPAEETEVPPVEEPIDYMPLIYEELQTQNELLVEMTNQQTDAGDIVHEGFFMVVFAIIITAGVKVFIDQVTKW